MEGSADLDFDLLRLKLVNEKFEISTRIAFAYNLDAKTCLSNKILKEKEIYLGELKLATLTLGLLITPIIKVFAKITPEGKLSFSLGYKGEVSCTFTAKNIDGQWIGIVSQDSEPKGYFDIKGLEFDGSLSETFNLSARLTLFCNSKNSIGITPDLEFKQEAHLDLIPSGLLNSYNYAEIQENDKIAK